MKEEWTFPVWLYFLHPKVKWKEKYLRDVDSLEVCVKWQKDRLDKVSLSEHRVYKIGPLKYILNLLTSVWFLPEY